MRKRRPEPKSAAVREAETALVVCFTKVVKEIQKLKNEIRDSARFLESLLRGRRDAVAIERRLKRMQRDWPELFDKRKGD